MVLCLVLTSVPAAAAEDWKQLDDMPFQTYVFSTAYLPDGKVFFNGGQKEGANGISDETWIYDTHSDTWESKASSPLALVGASAVYMPDGNVYVFCGKDPNGVWDHDVMIYNVAGDNWSTLPANLDMGSYREAAALDDTRILIAGGLTTHPMLPVDQCLIFDTYLQGFYLAESLPYPIGYGAMVKAGDSMYYVGGYDPNAGEERTLGVLRYGILTGHWEVHGQMSEPIMASDGVLAGDGLVHLYGSFFSLSGAPVSRALDLRDCSFRPCPAAPTKAVYGGLAATDDGRVVVFGGEHEDVVSQEVYSLTLFEKNAWLGAEEAGPGDVVRVYADVNAVAAGPEGMTATAYLVKGDVTYGTYDLVGLGNGTASVLMTLPEDLEAGQYEVYVTNVDLGVGVPGMIEFAPLSLTVTGAPTPTDRLADLQEQLSQLRNELNDTRAELAHLQESSDGKMDATVGYVLVALAVAVLAVCVLTLLRKK